MQSVRPGSCSGNSILILVVGLPALGHALCGRMVVPPPNYSTRCSKYGEAASVNGTTVVMAGSEQARNHFLPPSTVVEVDPFFSLASAFDRLAGHPITVGLRMVGEP